MTVTMVTVQLSTMNSGGGERYELTVAHRFVDDISK